MKKISYLISALALMFLANSCNEKEGTLFDFGGKNYASFDAAKYTLNASSEGKYTVYLYHMSEAATSASYTISVDCGGNESLFTVSPTQITFDKDNNKVPIEIRYNMADLELFKPYTVTLSIPEQATSGGIAITKQVVEITLQPKWEFFAEGVFFSDLFTWWEEEDMTWTQVIHKGLGVESLGIEVYKMTSLYTAGLDFIFTVDATTGKIGIPGVTPDENGFYLWSTGYRISATHGYFFGLLDPDPEYTWFDKTTKTANFSSIIFTSVSNIELGYFDEFFDWGERGPVEPVFDYSADIEFTGRFTNTGGKDFALADVTLGADVAYAKVALVAGEWDEAIVDGIIDGTIESKEIQASGSVSTLCTEQGVYTYVVVTFDDDDEAKEAAYVTFVFPPVDVNIEDFFGDYILTGIWIYDSSWDGNMSVTIEEGDEDNTLTITGIDFTESITATFNPVSGTISIAPQDIADYYDDYYDSDMTNAVLLTLLPNGDESETAVMTFRRMINGELQLTPASEAIGYIIFGEDEDGDFLDSDGYFYPVFTPVSAPGPAKKSVASRPNIQNRAKGSAPVVVLEEEIVEITKKGSSTIKRKKVSARNMYEPSRLRK